MGIVGRLVKGTALFAVCAMVFTAAPGIAEATTWTNARTPAVTQPATQARLQQEVLAEVNRARSKPQNCGGTIYPAAPALQLDPALNQSSLRHSQEMATKNYFNHASADGTTPWTRMTAAGYDWSTAAENIAAGYLDAAAAVKGWMESPGHCKNIMGASFTEIGVGVAYDKDARYEIYWTTDFGARAISPGALNRALPAPQATTKSVKAATPKIKGTAKVGKKLTVSAGKWGPPKVTLSYQWYRNGKKIAKATGSSYKLVKKDKGTRITVKVTGAKSGYKTVTKTSCKTAVVKK